MDQPRPPIQNVFRFVPKDLRAALRQAGHARMMALTINGATSLLSFESAVCPCQATYDRPQHWFFYPVRRARCRDPLDLTLASFWPFLILTLHLQWEDVHFANDHAAVLNALFVFKRPKRAPGHCPNNASLFISFTRSRMMGCFAFLWPALWNDPSSCFARGDKHDLARPAAEPVRQSSVLNALWRTWT